MDNETITLLLNRRQELDALHPQPWSNIEAWVARTTPLIRKYWPEYIEDFQRTTILPRVSNPFVYVGTYLNDPMRQAECERQNARSSAAYDQMVTSNAEKTKQRILGLIDGIIETAVLQNGGVQPLEHIYRNSNSPIRVFCSYSHKDEALRNELTEHLHGLIRENSISEWHDRKISAGGEWKDQIDANLNSAHIILLLISASFLASDYCYDKEMLRALERHERREARVIPIIIRDCDWHTTPFAKLQALPTDGHPITGSRWSTQDEALSIVAKGIRKVVAEITRERNGI